MSVVVFPLLPRAHDVFPAMRMSKVSTKVTVNAGTLTLSSKHRCLRLWSLLPLVPLSVSVNLCSTVAIVYVLFFGPWVVMLRDILLQKPNLAMAYAAAVEREQAVRVTAS